LAKANNEIQVIKNDFTDVQPLLNVIGDETRQLILMVLMEAKCSEGMRVGEITEKTHLSRPAVSHQLKILKDLELVKVRCEGTKNFYNIDVTGNRELLGKLKKLVIDIETLVNHLEETE
jgi:DNA-binding transcriptional ArsR family regulator